MKNQYSDYNTSSNSTPYDARESDYATPKSSAVSKERVPAVAPGADASYDGNNLNDVRVELERRMASLTSRIDALESKRS